MGSKEFSVLRIFLEHISQARASGRKYSDMEWHPASFFRTDITPQTPFAILILNQPINENAFDAVRRHGTFSSLLQAIFFSKTRTRVDKFDFNRTWRKMDPTPRLFDARIHVLTWAG